LHKFKWEERKNIEITPDSPEITPYSSPVVSPAAVAIHYEFFTRLGKHSLL